MTTRKEFDRYFRQHYPDVRHAVGAIYLWGLPELEAERTGRVIVDSLDRWASITLLDRHTVRKALSDLHQLNLVEFLPGKAGLGKEASIVRRRTSDEIKTLSPREVLEKYIPADLEQLAQLLTERGVPWYKGNVHPLWSVQRTGRIGAKGAPPAGISKEARHAGFLASLDRNEELVEIDIKSAEPSILMHELVRLGLWTKPEPGYDVYGVLGEAEGIDRKQAKRRFLKAAYSPARVLADPRWPREVHSLVFAVNRYRDHLWLQCPPTAEQHRHIYTIGGRKMLHDGRSRMHRGKLLAWRLQGTVADVIMPITKGLIEKEKEGEYRFYCQNHDSIVSATRRDETTLQIRDQIVREINNLGLELEVQITRNTAPPPHE
jgi:hypothetical protein